MRSCRSDYIREMKLKSLAVHKLVHCSPAVPEAKLGPAGSFGPTQSESGAFYNGSINENTVASWIDRSGRKVIVEEGEHEYLNTIATSFLKVVSTCSYPRREIPSQTSKRLEHEICISG